MAKKFKATETKPGSAQKTLKPSAKTTNNKKVSNEILVISDHLTIASIKKLKKSLDKQLGFPRDILVEAKNLQSIELSGIQLLFALKKNAEGSNRKVVFNIKLNKEASRLIRKAGFNLQKMIA